jgi:hypothetical protein
MVNRQRRKTALILTSMSLFMFSPVLMQILGDKLAIFHDLGFEKGNSAPWYAWISGIIVVLIYVLYTFKKIPIVYKMQKEISLFKFIGLFAIIGGLIEEVVFRQWLMDLLMVKGYGLILQILISALMFSVIHVIWVIFGGELKFILGALKSTFGLGILLSLVYLIGNRNVGPCIISHSLINVIIEPWLLLSAVSKAWKTT